jgi:hypothetical protein
MGRAMRKPCSLLYVIIRSKFQNCLLLFVAGAPPPSPPRPVDILVSLFAFIPPEILAVVPVNLDHVGPWIQLLSKCILTSFAENCLIHNVLLRRVRDLLIWNLPRLTFMGSLLAGHRKSHNNKSTVTPFVSTLSNVRAHMRR